MHIDIETPLTLLNEMSKKRLLHLTQKQLTLFLDVTTRARGVMWNAVPLIDDSKSTPGELERCRVFNLVSDVNTRSMAL